MAKRIPVQTVIVVRDGKRVSPPIGKPFDFTKEELSNINDRNPDAIRKLTDESVQQNDGDDGDDDLDARQEAEAAAAEKAAQAAKTGGKGANKSDDDDL